MAHDARRKGPSTVNRAFSSFLVAAFAFASEFVFTRAPAVRRYVVALHQHLLSSAYYCARHVFAIEFRAKPPQTCMSSPTCILAVGSALRPQIKIDRSLVLGTGAFGSIYAANWRDD